MRQIQTVHINFKGGIVSPGSLKEVLTIAALANVKAVRFGLRQQLIIDLPIRKLAAFENACNDKQIVFYRKKGALPNIMSSYAAAGIFTRDTWLREGVYKDIFDLFAHRPKLKINICDSTQTLVPFFTGHINWISSTAAHFWHLYIRFPNSQTLYCFPELIYTNEIAGLSKRIEELILNDTLNASGAELHRELKLYTAYISKPVDQELQLPQFSLPYYEGFNKYDVQYWLGIYRRDEIFSVAFLLDLCAICAETKIGQLYTTPWKSLIIKGIDANHRTLWDHTLGNYRINVRHAANELAWQVEDNVEEGLLLKRLIIRHFDKEDVRTYGLSFAVQTQPHSGMFGSVLVRKLTVRNPGGLKGLDRYEICYTEGFNPNSAEMVSFRKQMKKEYLGIYLAALCKFYYEQQSNQQASLFISQKPAAAPEQILSTKMVYQCKHCLTIYDESGDNSLGVVPLNKLPENYQCSLCEAGLEDFVAVEESSLKLQIL